MKTFSQILSEVAQPKAGDEIDFKDKHIVQKVDYPVDVEDQFTSKKPKAPKRRADYNKGEDEAVYESSFEVPTAEGGEYDEEDTHKKYKSSNKSKALHKEAKMDPVGKEDEDIDNDGGVDSSDKYLHNRRKTIKKAMRESIEMIAEKAKSEAQQKAAAIALAVKRGDMPKSALQGASAAMYKMSEKDLEDFAKTKHKGIPEKVSEEAELDEARKSDSYQFTHKPGDPESEKRLADLKQSVKGTGKRVVLQGRLGKDNPNAHKYSKNAPRAQYKDGKRVNADVSGKSGAHSHQRIQKADASHHDVYVYNRNESVELDEISKSTLGRYVKAASTDAARKTSEKDSVDRDYPKASFSDRLGYKKQLGKKLNQRRVGISKAVDRLTKEEVELDEAMKLDKVNHVYHDTASEKFAKEYVKGNKGDYQSGGPSEKHEKDSEKFHTTYKRVGGKSGFGGSGHDIYQHTKTGEKYRVNRQANGKGFYGTDHRVSKLNEEVELDEISKNLAHSYYRKASKDIGDQARSANDLRGGSSDIKGRLYRKKPEDREKSMSTASKYDASRKTAERKIKNRAVGMSRASARMEEVEQLDELSPSTLKSYMKKAGKSERDLEKKDKEVSSAISKVHTAVGKKSTAANAAHRATTQKASNKAGTQYRAADKQIKDTSGLVKQKSDIQRKLANRMDGMGRASERLHKEEVELDEIAKDTLRSYRAAALSRNKSDFDDLSAERERAMKKYGHNHSSAAYDLDKSIKRRGKYINLAAKKMNAKEEVEQINEISDKLKAKYLDKAVQQRYDFFKEPWDPKKEPKWATPGGKPKKGYYDQPHKVKAREKDARRGEIIDKTAQKLTGKPHYSTMSTVTTPGQEGNAGDWWKGKKYAKEEFELNEVSGKTLRKYLSKASDRMTDINTKADSETDSEKRKTLYKDLGKRRVGMSLARGKLTGEPYKKNPGVDNTMLRAKVHAEEFEQIDEAFKSGSVKLNDGSSVALKEQDAKLMNQLFDDLNADNKKKMMAVAMKDKSGFNEILGFAREAL